MPWPVYSEDALPLLSGKLPENDVMHTMNTRPIRFFHRGAVVAVDNVAPTTSVLDWLREHARCSGTKEGCNEGDCGACTVVVASRARADDTDAIGGLALRAVNACTQFLPTLDGKALFTVEDVGGVGARAEDALHPMQIDKLHPVQRALVDCHGSQCGFCTPGFVMSMWSTYEHHCERGTRPTRRELADDLSGNLCRCTGYRPILDAGERMFDLPARRLDTQPVAAALASIAPEGTFAYEAPNVQLPEAPRHTFFAPRTLDELATLYDQKPDARLLAGSTDIGLWVTKRLEVLPELIYVGEVEALARVHHRSDGTVLIGAGASLERAWAALAQRHDALREVALRFASPPVRWAGTMGGNVANGSPIGDSAPVLLALDASVVLRKGFRVRRMPLAEFYVDYMKNRLEPGELLQAIEVPPPVADLTVRSWKISKRYDCDISALCTGFSIVVDAQGVARHVRLAYGGMAAIVKRAANAEAQIAGQPWTEATMRAAQAALERDFTPLTDMRASGAYRLTTARNLLERFWLETRVHDPLDAAATSVWAFA
jgi:xanthine dehydrogenase small subunit